MERVTCDAPASQKASVCFYPVQVTQFLAECHLAVDAIEDLDEVSSWIEHIFFEGESKGLWGEAGN